MPAFSCRFCGHCCHGQGGTVLSPKDLARLATFFDMSSEDFLSQYTSMKAKKPRINTRGDGFCIFYDPEKSCTIHAARPDICRAWPYFRGNLIDRVSFEMAREDCLGIPRDISHVDFAHIGYNYLKENDLLAQDEKKHGRALIVAIEELPLLAEDELGK